MERTEAKISSIRGMRERTSGERRCRILQCKGHAEGKLQYLRAVGVRYWTQNLGYCDKILLCRVARWVVVRIILYLRGMTLRRRSVVRPLLKRCTFKQHENERSNAADGGV